MPKYDPFSKMLYDSYRGAVRNAARRRRQEHNRLLREVKNEQLRKIAHQEVEKYNATINHIRILHCCKVKVINWENILQSEDPAPPHNSKYYENIIQNKIDNYSPSIFTQLFSSKEKAIAKLEDKLLKARERDQGVFDDAMSKFEAKLKEIQDKKNLAKSVLDKNPEVYVNIIEKHLDNFLKDTVTLNFKTLSGAALKIEMSVKDADQLVTLDKQMLTKTGKLSSKKHSKTELYSIYFDLVIGYHFYVLRQSFLLLPLEKIFFEIYRTGCADSSENGLIFFNEVSLRDLQTLSQAKTEDSFVEYFYKTPTELLEKCDHKMEFRKTKGFAIINK